MSRFKRIEYTKSIGCHHNDKGDLVGGTPIEMVALYDSEFLSEEEAQLLIKMEEPNKHLMLIYKYHYDNILVPAVEEAKTSHPVCPIRVGQTLYYSENINDPAEKCRVHYIGLSSEGQIKDVGLTFLNDNDEEIDADIFEPAVMNDLYKSLEDIQNCKNILN